MLHDSTVALLAQIISRNNNIKRVDLSDNVITAEGADQLSLALQINRSVEHMDLSYNRLQDAGLLQISAALPTHPELRSLNLRGNKIGDTGIKGLVDWIMHQDDSNVEFVRKTRGFSISKKEEGGYMPMHTFPRLELSENRIGPDGVKALCKLITYNRSITSLDLHSNMVDDVGAEYLAALIISGYHGLKELSLSQNQISSVGASKLAEAIQACKSELVVDLSGNPLLGREAVAVMLRTGMDLSFEFLKVHLRPGSMPMPVVPSGRSTPDSVSRSLTTRTYSDNFKLSANKIVEEKEEENITPNASPERGFSRPVPLSCKCTHVCVCGGSGVVVPEKAKDMADMSPMISNRRSSVHLHRRDKEEEGERVDEEEERAHSGRDLKYDLKLSADGLSASANVYSILTELETKWMRDGAGLTDDALTAIVRVVRMRKVWLDGQERIATLVNMVIVLRRDRKAQAIVCYCISELQVYGITSRG
eukprot:g63869.t1